MIAFIVTVVVVFLIAVAGVAAMLWVVGGAMKDLCSDAWKDLK